MKALDRKLLRDLRLMWSQALTIALVVASGIGGFITTLSAVESLELARDRFYAQGRFADVFATVKRAPNALAETLRATPGVADVQTTIEQMVRIDIDGVADPIIGQLIGVDLRAPPAMNRVTLQSGRALDDARLSGSAIPALVSPGFAEKRGLKPGARVGALINGKRRALEIVGIALSPEYIFAGLMGMPDLRGVGVFWVPQEALAAAYDMEGAFNRVAVKLAHRARRSAPSSMRCRRSSRATAAAKPMAARTSLRMRCSPTRSRNSMCSAPCCRRSFSASRPSCSTSSSRASWPRSASRSRR